MSQKNSADLTQLRDQIDAIDTKIQSLIAERAGIAGQVAASKRHNKSAVYYRPERESQVLRAVKARNQGPLSDEVLVRLFREIMSACLAQQKPLKIAFLGPEGTFSEMATYRYFGHSVQAMPESSIDQVFTEVEAGVADFGVVPIENSTEGAVNNTLDMFMSSPLKICGEIDLPIHHYLMSKQQRLDDIKIIYSHRQTLAQCRGWLKSNAPDVETVAVSSNAEAARRAAYSEHAAAIAGQTTAALYGLHILHQQIEDQADNATRFLIIGNQLLAASGDDKTSLMIAAKDEPGLLYHILRPMNEQGVTMTRIESRPSKRKRWDYVFFIDMIGHVDDKPIAATLREIQRFTQQVKVLGSYPKSV